MFRRSYGYGILILSGLLTGCSQNVDTKVQPASKPGSMRSDDTGKPSDASDESTTDTAAGADMQLVEANWSEVQKLIAEQKGNVVVLHVWSTACEPCMKEFPHLIALQNRFPKDVVAISFDIDYAGIKKKPVSYYRERVLKFLGSQPANNVLHRMCNTPADELFTEINLDSIPAVYVYGRNGNLAKRFDGSNSQGEGVSYETQVIPFVVEQVK